MVEREKGSMRFYTLILGILAGAVGVAGLSIVIAFQSSAPLQVVFLDVGQGDATLISQGNIQILIDGGRDGKVLLAKLGRFMPFWDRHIEAVIVTHPDADHIGGVAAVLRRYRVDTYLSNGAEVDSAVFEDLQLALAASPSTHQAVIGTGSRLVFPQGGELSTLFPATGNARGSRQTNEESVVTRLVFGETSFLFLGDLPREEVVLPEAPETDILKVAHHGSKYSTSLEWLERTRPQTAVISVGKNSYGHPAQEVLERLHQSGVETLRTDHQGDIHYVCRESRCERQ